MSEAWVSFLGICTFLRGVPGTPAMLSRFVLVNATDPTPINERYHLKVPIPPHIARLAIFKDQIARIEGDPLPFRDLHGLDALELTLDGYSLGFGNAAISRTADEAICLPHLSSLVPDVAPGPAVNDYDPAHASCYFDFESGSVQGFKSKNTQAGFALFSTMTPGEPQLAIIRFKSESATKITLKNLDPRRPIYVRNQPEDGRQGTDNDFLLHFLASRDQFPPTLPLQLPASDCPISTSDSFPTDWETGPGCSNSNLP